MNPIAHDDKELVNFLYNEVFSAEEIKDMFEASRFLKSTRLRYIAASLMVKAIEDSNN